MTFPDLDNAQLTRDEANRRADLITVHTYNVDVDVRNAEDTAQESFGVDTTITFDATEGSETFLNYLGAEVETITLNDRELDPATHAGSARIQLPNLGEHNTVTIRSRSFYSRSGEGLHRFVDPASQRTYLYTQYEPADARRVFPNFEQPDLKAKFTFSLHGPEGWEYASNAPEASRTASEGNVHVRFEETLPVSTYITTLLAGPYKVWSDEWEGHEKTGAGPIALRIFSRQEMAEATDTQRLFTETKNGLTWFHDMFGYAYPWGKYDQAFVPEYNLGAMENPGLVTFNEDYIFTSKATTSQYQNRANTLMHEMVHMWFGDLVTMKWWDDLWLKESFADYIGAMALDEATDYEGAWVTFAHGRKAWAYVQDSYPTTHPIVADIVDLEAARQNFDGITYAKGAAVLKQLGAYVGRETFLQASRTYFSRHEFGTGELADFLAILEEVSGQDMKQWAQLWLQTAGPSVLRADIQDGEVLVTQRGTDPTTGDHVLRPHTFHVGVYQLRGEALELVASQAVELPAGQESVVVPGLAEMIDPEKPRLILPNEQDLTYALIDVDAESLRTALDYPITDPLAVATVWSMLWAKVRWAQLPAREFVTSVAKLHGSMTDVGTHARVLHQAVVAINGYAPETEREDLRHKLINGLVNGLETLGDGSDRQRSAAKTLATLGQGSDVAYSVLMMLLGSDDPLHTSGAAPGLVVDAELRWMILTALASQGHVDSQRLDAELETDPSSNNVLFYREALAALPQAEQRRALWHTVLNGETEDGEKLSNSQITATAQGLNASAPQLTADLWPTLVKELENIWASRSNGLASRTINGLFPMSQLAIDDEDQTKHPVIADTDAWLKQHPDAPAALRRVVIERREDLLVRLTAQFRARA